LRALGTGRAENAEYLIRYGNDDGASANAELSGENADRDRTGDDVRCQPSNLACHLGTPNFRSGFE
jgi:hypothetical protein